MNFLGNNKKIIIAVAIGLVVILAGISAGVIGMNYVEKQREETEAVKDAVKASLDSFCAAVKANDISTAKLYCGEDVVTQMGMDLMDVDTYGTLVLDGLGIAEDDLNDTASEGFDALKESMKGIVLTGVKYNMEELSIGKTDASTVAATLPVQLNGCGSLVNLDFSGVISLANVGIANYTSDNQKTLMDLLDDAGVEAVHRDIQKQMYGSLLSAISGQVMNTPNVTHDWVMTFSVGRDDDGKISSATLVRAVEKKETGEEP